MSLTQRIRAAMRRARTARARGDTRLARSASRVARRLRSLRLRQTVAFDGVPLPRGLALVLEDARKAGVRFTLLSADRRKGVAERFGHSSQAALYACWRARKPGCNPANPPGRSTHELRSDGAAYRGPVGRRLAYWQMGMDLDNSEALRSWAVQHGYLLFRPYRSATEYHHLNFLGNPRHNYRRRHAK